MLLVSLIKKLRNFNYKIKKKFNVFLRMLFLIMYFGFDIGSELMLSVCITHANEIIIDHDFLCLGEFNLILPPNYNGLCDGAGLIYVMRKDLINFFFKKNCTDLSVASSS